MKPMILVTAPVETRSGYGNHSRDICQALIEMDKYDVRIQSVRWGSTPPNALEKDNPIHQEINKRILRQPSLEKQPDLHLHIVIPNEFQAIGKINIGMTAGIEHTIPPASWVEGCNRMDMTIFTSHFSRDGFTNVAFDKLDNNTAIIFRNYNKKINLTEILKIKEYCSNKKIKFFLSNNFKIALKLRLNGAYIPSFNKNFNLLNDSLTDFFKKGYKLNLFFSTFEQSERFKQILDKYERDYEYKSIIS